MSDEKKRLDYDNGRGGIDHEAVVPVPEQTGPERLRVNCCARGDGGETCRCIPYQDHRCVACQSADKWERHRAVVEAAKAADEVMDNVWSTVWDSHYGNGVTTEYARSTDKKVRLARKNLQRALAALEKE